VLDFFLLGRLLSFLTSDTLREFSTRNVLDYSNFLSPLATFSNYINLVWGPLLSPLGRRSHLHPTYEYLTPPVATCCSLARPLGIGTWFSQELVTRHQKTQGNHQKLTYPPEKHHTQGTSKPTQQQLLRSHHYAWQRQASVHCIASQTERAAPPSLFHSPQINGSELFLPTCPAGARQVEHCRFQRVVQLLRVVTEAVDQTEGGWK
jgi:hypothetical protein